VIRVPSILHASLLYNFIWRQNSQLTACAFLANERLSFFYSGSLIELFKQLQQLHIFCSDHLACGHRQVFTTHDTLHFDLVGSFYTTVDCDNRKHETLFM